MQILAPLADMPETAQRSKPRATRSQSQQAFPAQVPRKLGVYLVCFALCAFLVLGHYSNGHGSTQHRLHKLCGEKGAARITILESVLDDLIDDHLLYFY
jgi:hypothetical protein